MDHSYHVSPSSQQLLKGIHVAGLNLLFEGGPLQLDLGFSLSHQQFILNDSAEVNKTSAFSDTLILQLQQINLDRQSVWKQPICFTEIWELWQDESGQLIFYNPLQPLLRQVIVAPDFTHGRLVGNYHLEPHPVRPLSQDLEIVLFSNWLAKFGDVILHASGFIYDGKAYVFAGDAGVGKSTLATHFSKKPAFNVLGEDQVILRLKDDQFWVYGTPWHINHHMCSSQGAPLACLFFLERDGVNKIKPLTSADGIKRLMQTAFIPYYRPDAVNAILKKLILLSGMKSFMSLSYQLGGDVWNLIRSSLSIS